MHIFESEDKEGNTANSDPGSPSSRLRFGRFAGVAEHNTASQDGRLATIVVGNFLPCLINKDIGNAGSRTTRAVMSGLSSGSGFGFARGEVER